ncbi:erythromycin esterase family protein [Halorussus ruber]|uniref:erythromycin esterase family protein n=1 Tax=Halorussus ruber TaxID=1126238 RepID=UPI001B2FEBCF|nr:erythromycin esterase family protein [Halorussus ruber]
MVGKATTDRTLVAGLVLGLLVAGVGDAVPAAEPTDEEGQHDRTPVLGDERRGHRAIGVVYDPDREAYNYVPTNLAERYDSFVHARTRPRSTRSASNPTRAKRPKRTRGACSIFATPALRTLRSVAGRGCAE